MFLTPLLSLLGWKPTFLILFFNTSQGNFFSFFFSPISPETPPPPPTSPQMWTMFFYCTTYVIGISWKEGTVDLVKVFLKMGTLDFSGNPPAPFVDLIHQNIFLFLFKFPYWKFLGQRPTLFTFVDTFGAKANIFLGFWLGQRQFFLHIWGEGQHFWHFVLH